MESIESVSNLDDRLDEVMRYRALRSRRYRYVILVMSAALLAGTSVIIASDKLFDFPVGIREVIQPLLTPVLGLWGVLIGFYYGSSNSDAAYSRYKFDELDVYKEAVKAREESVLLRSVLLKEQAELRRRLIEQEKLIAELNKRNSSAVDN